MHESSPVAAALVFFIPSLCSYPLKRVAQNSRRLSTRSRGLLMYLRSRSLVISRIDDTSQSWLSVDGPYSSNLPQLVQRQLRTTHQVGKPLYRGNDVVDYPLTFYKKNNIVFSGYAKFLSHWRDSVLGILLRGFWW